MIRINKITGGRLGNRILQYNCLVQLADSLGVGSSCVNWEGADLFDHIQTPSPQQGTLTHFSWKNVLEDDWQYLDMGIDYALGPYCLHNTFYRVTKKDPRNFMCIRQEFQQKLSSNRTNIGIHIRGDDIIESDGNNGREIHEPKYYRDSIDVIEHEFENATYYVCTDDPDFATYKETIKYLTDADRPYHTGAVSNHFQDFATLSECDVLISSSSTFVLCAGFLGKENKKIIHSREWIERNMPGDGYFNWGNYTNEYPEDYWKAYDRFWLQLYDGGSDFYRAWRFI